MKKIQTGLYQYDIFFKTLEELNKYKHRYRHKQAINTIFINNDRKNKYKYAIEVTVLRKIM